MTLSNLPDLRDLMQKYDYASEETELFLVWLTRIGALPEGKGASTNARRLALAYALSRNVPFVCRRLNMTTLDRWLRPALAELLAKAVLVEQKVDSEILPVFRLSDTAKQELLAIHEVTA